MRKSPRVRKSAHKSLSVWAGGAITSLALFLTLSLFSTEAHAQAILRDAETEAFLQDISAPLYRVSGIQADRVLLYVEDRDNINAFATASHLIVLSAGLLETANDPSELQGVIAHEIAHITSGHHVAAGQAQKNAERSYLLAAAAGLVLAGATSEPEAVIAGASIGQEVAVKGYLAHSRANEQAADQAAVNFLRKAMISPVGLLEVNQRLKKHGDLIGEGNVYWRTHPLTSERVSFLRNEVARSPYSQQPTELSLRNRFHRIRAKLDGFRNFREFLEQHDSSEQDIAIRYGRSLALLRHGQLEEALEVITGMLAEEPDNPFFHEVHGQVLHTMGRAGESAAAYAEAVRLFPDAPLLRLAWASSLINTRDAANNKLALRQLLVVREAEESLSHVWRLTQVAYAREGRAGRALLAQSERSLLEGRAGEAGILARRAYAELPADDTPGRTRASDILYLLGESAPE